MFFGYLKNVYHNILIIDSFFLSIFVFIYNNNIFCSIVTRNNIWCNKTLEILLESYSTLRKNLVS